MASDFDLEGKNKAQKAVYYLKHYGMGYTVKKALIKLGVPVSEESEYMAFCRKREAGKRELEEQASKTFPLMPRFSIVSMQGKDARLQWKKQSYQNRELLAVSGQESLEELLQLTDGEYFVFAEAGIFVHPAFLYEAVSTINEDPGRGKSSIRNRKSLIPEVIYTDEDNFSGKKRYRPFFKPDYSPQLLLNFQYLGKCFIVKRKLLEKLKKLPQVKNLHLFGNHWYLLALYACHEAAYIAHIPKVLFSNMVNEGEREQLVRSRDKQQMECIEAYLKAYHIEGEAVKSDVPGFFHVRYPLPKTTKISIIIPNKDHIDELKVCIDSLTEVNTYGNIEILIAENNSEDPNTFVYYDSLQKDSRIRVICYTGGFNYSAVNNFAAKEATGSLLLFLNNDTKVMTGDSLRELAAAALLPGAGASGAMLYYEDKTIQHGGVTIGLGGFAANSLWSLTDRDEKYYPFSLCLREVSAATAACLMVRKEVFEEVGGFSEAFVVALNDVDLCLKIRQAGYAILFNPYAKLFHYESKSRGYEDTMEKQKRFQKEINMLQEKWKAEIEEGDPYYNPNLTLHKADYSIDIQ